MILTRVRMKEYEIVGIELKQSLGTTKWKT